MGLIGSISIKLGVDASKLNSGLANAGASVSSFGDRLTQTSTLIKGAFAAAIGGAGAMAIGKMIKSSSDLAESVGKIGAIFGGQGGAIEQDARNLADAFGVSLNEMLDGAGKLGGLFKGAGFDEQATAGLSKQFNHLALDASRFFNVPYDVAFQKIRSGLVGEAEPLKDFGINLTAAKVEAEALALGLTKTGETMSDQAKMTASASLISKGLADAQGNAAETAGGTAAQIESLSGRFENLMTTLGEGLAPVAGRVLGGINTAIAAMTDMWNSNKDSVFGWTSSVMESLGLTGEGVNVIEVAVGGIATAWQAVSLVFKSTQMVFQEVFTAMFDGMTEVVKVFDGAAESIFGASSGIGEQLGVMTKSLKDSLAESRKAFADEMAKPWAWRAVGDQFQATRDKLKSLQTEASKAPDAIAALVGKGASGTAATAGAKAASKSDKLFGPALKLGSAEAASTMLRSRYGGEKDNTAENTKQTAAGVRESVVVQKQILKAVAQGPRFSPLLF
jgi:hypothetical protein